MQRGKKMLPEYCNLYYLVWPGTACYGRLAANSTGLNPGGRELITTGYGRLGARPQDSYPGAGSWLHPVAGRTGTGDVVGGKMSTGK